MKLANLTLHSQERYKKDFAREGFDKSLKRLEKWPKRQ